MMYFSNNSHLKLTARSIRLFLFLLSISIFLGVMLTDYVTTGQIIATNPQPQFSGMDAVRSLCLLVSALLFVASITLQSNHIPCINGPSPFITLQFGKEWLFPLSTAMILRGSLFIAFTFALLFVISPITFSILGNEDYIIEISSALCLFIASANILIVSTSFVRQQMEKKPIYLAGLLMLAGSFLLIGMEEVSWFQRAFNLETPDAFSGNIQGEFNFHNFASTTSEIGYYSISFLYLILFPFVYERIALFKKTTLLTFFAPGLVTLFVGAPLAAFNFNLWNNAPIQWSFFVTSVVLVYYAYLALVGSTHMRYYLVILSILYLVTQVVFIWHGDHFVKGWEVTEYKELLIPMACLIYSLELMMKTRAVIGIKDILPAVVISLIVCVLRVLQKIIG